MICFLLLTTFQPIRTLAGEAGWLSPAENPLAGMPTGGERLPLAAELNGAAPVEWTFHKTADNLHPNGLEQQLIWLMNRARANPAAEGAWLAESLDPLITGARDYFQVDISAVEQEFAGYAPHPPAAFDARLYAAAKSHAEDMIARNIQDHVGQFDRVAAAGFNCAGGSGYAFRGNVYSYAESALNNHAGWNIDWGYGTGGMQDPRGHRMGVMALDGDYTNAGLAVLYENDPRTAVGPYVVVGDYCHAGESPDHYNRFLVGTVWQDRDGDGMYDPDEGIPGVTVTLSDGSFYAVTANSGGYAAPITQPGDYTVTFSGEVSGSREISIGADSLLVDFVYEPKPGDPPVRLPVTINRP